MTKLYRSKDGLVRSVNLRTNKGPRTRAIQRLHDLEISSYYPPIPEESSNLEDNREGTGSAGNHKSRIGRSIKVPRRMAL